MGLPLGPLFACKHAGGPCWATLAQRQPRLLRPLAKALLGVPGHPRHSTAPSTQEHEGRDRGRCNPQVPPLPGPRTGVQWGESPGGWGMDSPGGPEGQVHALFGPASGICPPPIIHAGAHTRAHRRTAPQPWPPKQPVFRGFPGDRSRRRPAKLDVSDPTRTTQGVNVKHS